MQPMPQILDPSPTFDISLWDFYLLVGNSDRYERGSSLHTAGGGGTVGSGDWAFCVVNFAALDLDSGLNECFSQRVD